MVAFNRPFNPDEFPEMERFISLPPGSYRMRCKNITKRKSRAGDDMLVIAWEVMDGKHSGQITGQFLNFWHSKPEVKRIAHTEFSNILRAMSLGKVSNTDTLRGKEVEAHLDESADASGRIRTQWLAFTPAAEHSVASADDAEPSPPPLDDNIPF